jgi:hypothetical protein
MRWALPAHKEQGFEARLPRNRVEWRITSQVELKMEILPRRVASEPRDGVVGIPERGVYLS